MSKELRPDSLNGGQTDESAAGAVENSDNITSEENTELNSAAVPPEEAAEESGAAQENGVFKLC